MYFFEKSRPRYQTKNAVLVDGVFRSTLRHYEERSDEGNLVPYHDYMNSVSVSSVQDVTARLPEGERRGFC